MLVHIVVFWLKPELTETQRADFRRGLETLKGVKAAEQVFFGKPAAPEKRPAIDDTYAYMLTTVFKDVAAHNAYQIDPIHQQFLQQFRPWFQRVQIYDAD